MTPKEKNANAIDYYVDEWQREDSLGWVARSVAERTGLSITDTLLFFNWMERFAQSTAAREQVQVLAEIAPLQLKALRQITKDDERDEGWRNT